VAVAVTEIRFGLILLFRMSPIGRSIMSFSPPGVTQPTSYAGRQ